MCEDMNGCWLILRNVCPMSKRVYYLKTIGTDAVSTLLLLRKDFFFFLIDSDSSEKSRVPDGISNISTCRWFSCSLNKFEVSNTWEC